MILNDREITRLAAAGTDAPAAQYAAFLRLWQGGAGWKHWKSSQACWSQWLTVNDEGKAVWR